MIVPFLAAFSFDGVERWQLWFDNPNKAAIFFAELLLLGVWLVLRRRDCLFWSGYVLSAVAAFGLLRTLSRGGLLACAIGMAFIIKRGWGGAARKTKLLSLVLLVVVLAILACHFKVQRRCLLGMTGKDASIQNRLALWSSAPEMFRAAPFGWGVGKSGEAYMKWFQPTDRHERYRTLVNSHLTSIVEFGWALGYLYLFTWCCALWAGVKARKSLDGGLCFGECICLFAGGMFSSVLESIWLWVLPVSVFLFSARYVVLHGLVTLKSMLIAAGVTFVAILCFATFGASGVIRIGKNLNWIQCGNGRPTVLLFPDHDVLGGEFYMRDLREALKARNGTVIVAANLQDIPDKVDLIVLSGRECRKIDAMLAANPNRELLLISPRFEMCEKLENEGAPSKANIWIGELSGCQIRNLDTKVRMFSGVGKYIPCWSSGILELADELTARMPES